MCKWKTLIVLLCIFGNALSQDNDEWSQEYNDYAGQLEELFKIPVDDEYDDIIKQLKQARDDHFGPQVDENDLAQYDEEVHELIKSSNENKDEDELNDAFYDTLVNDNGERSNDGPERQYSAEELEKGIEAESNEKPKIYYIKDQYEDTVNDENINGNARINDYDPDEFYEESKDEPLPPDSKEEDVQRENDSEHYLEEPIVQLSYQINVQPNITEEAKELLEEDIGINDDRQNETKLAKSYDNAEDGNNNFSSKIHEYINVNFEEKAKHTTETENKFKNENSVENNAEGKNDVSKLEHAENNMNNAYENVEVNLEQNKIVISQQENKSGDEYSNDDANDFDDIEDVYDDINEDIRSLMEIMKKINAETEDKGKSPEKFDNSHTKDDLENEDDADAANNNVVIDKPIPQTDERNVAEEKSSEDIVDFEFNEKNNQGANNYASAGDITDARRNQLKEGEHNVADVSFNNVEMAQPIPYVADEIETEVIDDDKKSLTSTENLRNYDENQSRKVNSNVTNDDDVDSAKIKENDVDDTKEEFETSIESLNNKIETFIDEHKDEILNSMNTFDISPINFKLSLDHTVTVTSPNYPEPYNGNAVIDWYFDGEGGTGIELNITHFSVDGNSGDYLLIKPGQTDTSGSNGIIFTYMLKQERRYRFMDVENMFVRFESKGSNFQNFEGFQFSVKFINPKVDHIVEPDPEPESVVKTPEQTHTLHLAGFTLHETEKVEAFRDILVDMAKIYVNAKWPQHLQTSLSEAVQLTRLTSCNMAWPNTDGCTSITFGIPLPDDDCCEEYRLTTAQMDEMWTTYSLADPFATRMRILGISEYESPNDRAILTVWWLWTFGAVLLVCAVAFTVHRLNCLNEYNGMRRLHEETGSAGSGRKSDLSLYPTPHQNLPPVFADGKFDHYLDGDYAPDNTTKVDLGGVFNNKGFVRDGELMDLDFDEEIIMSLPDEAKSNTRSSYSSGIRPRDVYGV